MIFLLTSLNFSYFGTVIMVIYKRMAGKRQETIPLLAGTGIPLTATGLALLCSSYYVLIGEECNPELDPKVYKHFITQLFNSCANDCPFVYSLNPRISARQLNSQIIPPLHFSTFDCFHRYEIPSLE